MILIDSSFLISHSLESDRNYERAHKIFASLPEEEQAVTEDILKETLTVISQRRGREYCIKLYEQSSIKFTVLPVSSDDFQAGLKLFLNPKLQKNVSVIDCVSAAICHKLGIKRILSFDSDFQLLGLKVVPSD
jgi:predicted nucleic acid-binding protein